MSLAFEKAQSGDTITLLTNITLDARLTFPSDKDLTLDLNEKIVTINNEFILINDSTSTVIVSIINGTIKHTGVGVNAPAIYANKAKKVEVRDVMIDCVSNLGILANLTGTIDVSKCSITAKVYAISNSCVGTTKITNCNISTVTCGIYTSDKTNGEITISDCTITGGRYGIIDKTKGTTTISNCTISNVTDAGINKTSSTSTTTISGCTISGPTSVTINSAVDASQVEEFKLNALAKINDIREYRKKISVLGLDGENIIQAITEFQNALNYIRNRQTC